MEVNLQIKEANSLPLVKQYSFEETIDGQTIVWEGNMFGHVKKTIDDKIADLEAQKAKLMEEKTKQEKI